MRNQVTEIRGSAQQLMEAITFAGDESDINAAVAKLAKVGRWHGRVVVKGDGACCGAARQHWACKAG